MTLDPDMSSDPRDFPWLFALARHLGEADAHMRRLREACQPNDVLNAYAAIEALVTLMRREDREAFHRNADVILADAMVACRDAYRAARVRELERRLALSAIVSRNRAIVFGDGCARIYEEGEDVRDAQDQKVAGLKVHKIQEASVTFRFEDKEFTKELVPMPAGHVPLRGRRADARDDEHRVRVDLPDVWDATLGLRAPAAVHPALRRIGSPGEARQA
jgi:hypothetical protein